MADWLPPIGERIDEIGYEESRWAEACETLEAYLQDDLEALRLVENMHAATVRVNRAYAQWGAQVGDTSESESDRAYMRVYLLRVAQYFTEWLKSYEDEEDAGAPGWRAFTAGLPQLTDEELMERLSKMQWEGDES